MPQSSSCCEKSTGRPRYNIGVGTMLRRQIRPRPVQAHLGLDRTHLHHHRRHHRSSPCAGSWPPLSTARTTEKAGAAGDQALGPPRNHGFAQRRFWRRRWEGRGAGERPGGEVWRRPGAVGRLREEEGFERGEGSLLLKYKCIV
jgi:hypothetical protein